MISTEHFFNSLRENGVEFFTGVPDSLLKDICAYITDNTANSSHIINANEGSSLAIAAGYHLSTGKIPLVYLQNSGLGNLVNPLLSLVDVDVYNIPALLMIGWRGEPGIKDEPQHIKQGLVMIEMLKSMGIEHTIIGPNSAHFADEISQIIKKMKIDKRPHAILVRKETFAPYNLRKIQKTDFAMTREEAIQLVLSSLTKDDLIVSTTGMISREVYENRKKSNFGHQNDFLTVGSMGHCSQIALGIALNRPQRQVICLDGDGSVIMHMGSLAITGNFAPKNFKHIVLNNGAHDSVGGQPTVGFHLDFVQIAKGCGYRQAFTCVTQEAFRKHLLEIHNQPGPCLLEVKVNKGARKDLIRPTTTPVQNKEAFMNYILEM